MADRILMQFPADASYTAAIRLAVSGIAGKLDFRVDDIEDIKSCISEACLLLMNGQSCRNLDFEIEVGQGLWVRVAGRDLQPDSDASFEDFSEEISRIMIEALSDGCSFVEDNGLLCEVSFEKARKGKSEILQ